MHLLITTPPLSVYEHMALDETAARVCPAQGLLRFYRWTQQPALSFGYAQTLQEVRALAAHNRFEGDFVRRPTGGGVVFHTDDLTFSLVFTCSLRPADIYKQLHRALLRELARAEEAPLSLGALPDKEAYKPSRHHTASACFINPVADDVLDVSGQKILGGALRRFGEKVLYQGSLQRPGARHNPLYKKALITGVRTFFAADLSPRRVEPAWLEEARNLAARQYQTALWSSKF